MWPRELAWLGQEQVPGRLVPEQGQTGLVQALTGLAQGQILTRLGRTQEPTWLVQEQGLTLLAREQVLNWLQKVKIQFQLPDWTDYWSQLESQKGRSKEHC